jgi:RNA polymerase sigma-70 factor, ECF subfamily
MLRAAVLASRGPAPETAPETAPGVGPALQASTDASNPAQGSRSPVREPDTAEGQRIRALVELAQSGDAEAFAQLYDRYVGTVYRYVYYRVGSRPLAEDLTSEAFLRALRRIETFSWRGRDFGAWLVTIARNLVADEFKSSRFRLEVATGEILDADEAADSPENEVLAALSSAALVDAIRQLKPQQQECVTLRFLQGMSVAETADIMGKNEGAIKTLQYRAVRSLARLLPGRP